MENHLKSNDYNGLALAYLGDAVYEKYIREFILTTKGGKMNNIHNIVSTNYTSAKAQKAYMEKILEKNLLDEYELSLFKKGRNTHPSTTRHNVELKDYLTATGFEALIGGLYLDGKLNRVEEIINMITGGGL